MSNAACLRGRALGAFIASSIALASMIGPSAAAAGKHAPGQRCQPGQHQSGVKGKRCERGKGKQRADRRPPETAIASGASGTISGASAGFAFTSSEPRSSFTCRLDGAAWAGCASPKAYPGIADGAHTFDVRATDPAGNTDPTRASRSFTVSVPTPPTPPTPPTRDTTPPQTTISSGPSGTINGASASFAFASSESGSAFECRLDSGSWGRCSSPRGRSDLGNGAHSFDVRATDPAGNTDPTPATRSFGVGVATGCQPTLSELIAPGCTVLKSDVGATANAASLWGQVECAAPTRAQLEGTGGDSHPTASGASQGNSAYWELTVVDGDDWAGERCELGRNDWTNGTNGGSGTFMTYPEGSHRVTFASFRFGSLFPFQTSNWQTVLQMKQAQPSNAGGGSPRLEVQLRNGRLYVESDFDSYWSTRVTQGAWIRMALDVRYSQDPDIGTITVYVDGNGDGDAADPGEVSPLIRTSTLKAEIAGPERRIPAGASIPGHLRVGVYHHTTISCPSGCPVDVDNVQVVDL